MDARTFLVVVNDRPVRSPVASESEDDDEDTASQGSQQHDISIVSSTHIYICGLLHVIDAC